MCMNFSFIICVWLFFFFFKQKTAYEMRISDWSSDVCSSDLGAGSVRPALDRMPGMDVDGVERRTAMDVSTRKEPKSGAEISSEITRLIYANPDVQAYTAQFHIPAATYHEPDQSGCNRTVHHQKATKGSDRDSSQAMATA